MDSSSIEQRNNSTSEASVSTADENSTTLPTDQTAESLESQQKAKARAEKAETIRQACDARDIGTLISSATTEGGLLDDELRQRACMVNFVLFLNDTTNNMCQGQFFYSVMNAQDWMIRSP